MPGKATKGAIYDADLPRIDIARAGRVNRRLCDASSNDATRGSPCGRRPHSYREAKRALESARYNPKRLKMNPPTTSLEEAEVNLAQAKDAEAQAEKRLTS